MEGGLPIWQAFVPDEPLRKGEREVLEFGTQFGSEIFQQTSGFNRNLGHQILQCAFDEGVTKGKWDRSFKILKPTFMAAVAIGEGAGKVRIPTLTEWEVAILLQPLGHILTETLRSLTQAASGLSRGEPLWHLVQELSQVETGPFIRAEPILANLLFMSSDLDKATDHMDPEFALYAIRGYLEGLGKDFLNPFILFSLSLLTGKRICTWRAMRDKNVRG